MFEILLLPLLAGIGVAATAAPLGCFVVWRRMAYLGDTIAHSSLLGVSLAVLFDTYLMLGVFFTAVGIAMLLLAMERRRTLSTDAILGILSHSSLAVGLVALSFLVQKQSVLMGFLFGDVLAVDLIDVTVIGTGGLVIIGILAVIWRPLLADTASHELAQAEGMRPTLARIIFMFLIAGLIALTMKIIGILLITALLIIPAATARRFAQNPEQMALIAVCFGAFAVIGGLLGSLQYDTPASPSIVLAAFVLFVGSYIPVGKVRDLLYRSR
ncbi:MAG: metal ABC transporter permease [Methyloligellaceae bacterium]